MKRGPERTVVKRESIDAACVRCTLECGHAVVVFVSQAADRLHRCRQCKEEHLHEKARAQKAAGRRLRESR